MGGRDVGWVARLANDRQRVSDVPRGLVFDSVHKGARFKASAAVAPVVLVEFLVAAASGMAVVEEPGFSLGGWFPAVWAWVFLIVLHRQLLLLRLPPGQVMVTADYRDALAKRSTYALVLVLGVAMVAIFSIFIGWPIPLSGVATILGIGGFVDLMGRDAAKFDSAALYAARRRVFSLASMGRESREIYLRTPGRFGIPHVNGVFGPALGAILSGGFGVVMFVAGKYAPRVPASQVEPLTFYNVLTIVLAAASVLLLLASWVSPRFEIWLTRSMDALSNGIASSARRVIGCLAVVPSRLRVTLRGRPDKSTSEGRHPESLE